MTAQQLMEWLDGFPADTEVRVIGERNELPIVHAARPIEATCEPVNEAFPFVALVVPGR